MQRIEHFDALAEVHLQHVDDAFDHAPQHLQRLIFHKFILNHVKFVLDTIVLIPLEHYHQLLVVALPHEFIRSVYLDRPREGQRRFFKLPHQTVDYSDVVADLRLQFGVIDLIEERKRLWVVFFLDQHQAFFVFHIIDIGVLRFGPDAVIIKKELIIFFDCLIESPHPVSGFSLLNIGLKLSGLDSVALYVIRDGLLVFLEEKIYSCPHQVSLGAGFCFQPVVKLCYDLRLLSSKRSCSF